MGRPQFAQVITQVSKQAIKKYEIENTGTVPGISDEKNTFYSSPNTKSELLAMYYRAQPPGAGTHELHLESPVKTEFSPLLEYLSATIDGSVELKFKDGVFEKNGTGFYEPSPSDQAAMVAMMQSVVFTEDIPLIVRYHNGGINDNTNLRYLNLVVLETEVK